MLLRSSSTPVLGSLIPSFSESPSNNNNNHQQHHEFHGSTSKQQTQQPGKLSCINGGSCRPLGRSLFSSSPLPEAKGTNRSSLIRRVQSEGNLEGLGDASPRNADLLNPYYKKILTKKPNCCTLEAIPSFSVHKLGSSHEQFYSDEEEESEEDEEQEEEDEHESKGNDDSLKFENMVYDNVRRDLNHGHDYSRSGGEGKMYLATGLGISGMDFIDGGGSSCGGGGGGSFRRVTFDMDGGGISMEEHYKKMLEENPGNPLVLRNYAQFLYQRKGDLKRAEEYYSRAILADPQDGEVLSQYAKLIWELNGDKERAQNYFDRAVQASSQDSHIHAAYASFLWDIDDDDDDDKESSAVRKQVLFHQHDAMASATA